MARHRSRGQWNQPREPRRTQASPAAASNVPEGVSLRHTLAQVPWRITSGGAQLVPHVLHVSFAGNEALGSGLGQQRQATCHGQWHGKHTRGSSTFNCCRIPDMESSLCLRACSAAASACRSATQPRIRQHGKTKQPVTHTHGTSGTRSALLRAICWGAPPSNGQSPPADRQMHPAPQESNVSPLHEQGKAPDTLRLGVHSLPHSSSALIKHTRGSLASAATVCCRRVQRDWCTTHAAARIQ